MTKLSEIPKTKLVDKIKASFLGLLFIGGGVYTVTINWPWYVSVGLAVVGGWMVSRELIEGSVGFLLKSLKELLPWKKK